MEITKKEVEKLIGSKVLEYQVIKTYRGYECTKIKVIAKAESKPEEIVITLKLKK